MYTISEASTHTYETLLCDASSALPTFSNMAANPHQNVITNKGSPGTQPLNAPPEVPQPSSPFYKTFLTGKPLALGIILIVSGTLQICLGIGLLFIEISPILFIVTAFWSSLFYIIAGSLTIAAQAKPNICLRGYALFILINLLVFCVSLSASIFGCRSLSCVPSSVTQVFVIPNEGAAPRNPPTAPSFPSLQPEHTNPYVNSI